MAKYRDKSSAGRSRICPFVKGEDGTSRHYRRKRFNVSAAEEMRHWCREHGVLLHISNYGHHWSFHLPDKQLWEWWPSSAKLVKNKHWSDGIHVHDYEQVQSLISAALEGHDGK
jgi:hypothetical protein